MSVVSFVFLYQQLVRNEQIFLCVSLKICTFAAILSATIMKFRVTVLTLLAFIVMNAAAYDFKFGNLYYTIISKTERTVEVAYSSARHSGKVVVPAEVTHKNRKWKVIGLGVDAFYGSTQLTEVVLPASLKYIVGGAFERCSGLKRLSVPAGVTLRSYALRNSGVESLRIPRGMKWSGRYMCQLANMPQLKTIEFDEGVEFIPNGAFQFDVKLERVKLPNTIRHIGNYAFVGCLSLRSLDIPSSVQSMGHLVDYGECSLQEIRVHWREPISIDARTFPRETYQNAVLYVPAGTKGKYRQMVGWSRFRNIEEM